jgi:hypothetical protein
MENQHQLEGHGLSSELKYMNGVSHLIAQISRVLPLLWKIQGNVSQFKKQSKNHEDEFYWNESLWKENNFNNKGHQVQSFAEKN